MRRKALSTFLVLIFAPFAFASVAERQDSASYRDVVRRTAAMTSDRDVQRLAAERGLQVLNVTWEDTGRFKSSAVGPNISDMTIQIQQRDPRTGHYSLTCMPVIRYPNFADVTADVPLDRFYLLVGNERGADLERVTLRDFLTNPRAYLTEPDSWGGWGRSLLARRDSHVLVSAQAAFLPIPRSGRAEFNPVLFNYQSYAGNPAVLTILATREGTSVTVIDNVRDAFAAGQTWGQRLFFNQAGERASLTGERFSDFVADPRVDPEGPSPAAAGTAGLSMVLLIQVPLKQKTSRRTFSLEQEELMSLGYVSKASDRSNVEAAVIGHGAVEGPFTEIDGLAVERDPRFPIRVTVQFYKATSNGVVSPADMNAVAAQIERVYADADYVGSLVTDGVTGRPTEHDGPKDQPEAWWQDFWRRFSGKIHPGS